MSDVNLFAEIVYSKVHQIHQSRLPLLEFAKRFSLSTHLVDVTGVKDSSGGIIQIGSIYNGESFDPPKSFTATTLEEHKAIAQERRNTIVSDKMIGGFDLEMNGVMYHYNTELEDQNNIKIFAQSAAITQEGAKIRVKKIDDGTLIELYHTPEMLNQVLVGLNNHIQTCKQISWRMDNDIKNAQSIEEVYAALNWDKE